MTTFETREQAEAHAKTIEGAWGVHLVRVKPSDKQSWIVSKVSATILAANAKKIGIYHIYESFPLVAQVGFDKPEKCESCRCNAPTREIPTTFRHGMKTVKSVKHVCGSCYRLDRVMSGAESY